VVPMLGGDWTERGAALVLIALLVVIVALAR
jgi:hypothetical protein